MKKILSLLLVLGLCVGLTGCGSGDSTDNTQQEEKVEKKEYGIGDTAEVEGIKITVNSTRIDEGIFSAPEGKQYFVLDISLENTTDEDFVSSSLMCYEIKDGDGREENVSIGANLNGSLDTTIAPGEKGIGEIAFETAPEGDLTLKFTPMLDKSVSIKVR